MYLNIIYVRQDEYMFVFISDGRVKVPPGVNSCKIIKSTCSLLAFSRKIYSLRRGSRRFLVFTRETSFATLCAVKSGLRPYLPRWKEEKLS